MDTPVEDLMNIGPHTGRWLRSVGICTLADLKAAGPVLAYKVVKLHFPEKVNVVLLYALQGAVDDVPMTSLSEELRMELKEASDAPLELDLMR